MSEIIQFFKSIKDTAFSMGVNDIIEIVIMAFVIYKLLEWMKNTRTWFIFRGLVAILLFFALAELLRLDTILYLARSALSIVALALIVIFQPELRGGIERLGKRNFLMNLFTGRSADSGDSFTEKVKEEIILACLELSRTRTGALIVIEKEDPLGDYIKTGIRVDAAISNQLLINIFEHNTPLHDGAVVVEGGRIIAATCYLPLSHSTEISKAFGTRHRAAIGVSEATDCVTIVVSEETGHISVARDGKLTENLSQQKLGNILDELVEKNEERRRVRLFTGKRRRKDEKSNS